MRRHRSGLTTALLLAAALVCGTAVSAWQAVRATTAQGRAEDHLTMGLRAVDELYDEVAARWLSDLRWGPLPRPFLEKVLPFYEEFTAGRRVDPLVGGAHRRIGEILIQLGRYKEAGGALGRAEAIGQALIAVDPENPQRLRDLAACYAARGELPQEWATRLAAQQKAIDLREALADRFPGVPLYRKELAASHQTLGNWCTFSRQAGADEHLDRAREIRERLSAENPADADLLCDLGVTLRGLSEVRGFAGHFGDAEPYSRRALAVHEGLLARHPTRPRFWLQLAWDCLNLGSVLEATRRYDEAGRVAGRAATMFEGLVSEYPDVSTYRENLAEALRVKVNALNQTGDRAEAERVIARLENLGDARGVSRRLAVIAWHLVQSDAPRANPPAYAVELAGRALTRQPDSVLASHVLGMAHYRAGDWDAAIEALGRANALEHEKGFAFNGFFVAMAYHRKGDHKQAHSWYDRSVAWMAAHEPKDRYLLRYRAEATALLGVKDSSTDDRNPQKAGTEPT